MSPFERRLRRYAVLYAALSFLVALVVTGLLPPSIGSAVVVLASLPLLWSWGAYQAHLALNETLDAVERQRWRVAFFLVPSSMALYWLREVRR